MRQRAVEEGPACRNRRPDAYFEEITNLPEVLTFQATEDLLAEATRLAVAIAHPIYDCLYIACAQATDSTLVTDDRRLTRAAQEHLPELEVFNLQDHDAIRRIEATTAKPSP